MRRRRSSRFQKVSEAYRDDWNLLTSIPTEAQLRKEIRYYLRLAIQARHSPDPDHRWRERLYRDHASHRRKLLAALKDGRPEAWLEYPD